MSAYSVSATLLSAWEGSATCPAPSSRGLLGSVLKASTLRHNSKALGGCEVYSFMSTESTLGQPVKYWHSAMLKSYWGGGGGAEMSMEG